MKRSLACLAAALACLATMSWATPGPFVQVVSASSSLANTCTAGTATSTVLANVDLPPGASYRYVVAFLVIPDPSMNMDDMDMMMMMMMGGGGMADPYYALLYQSPAINGPTLTAGASLSIGAPVQWYTTVPAVADHTTITAQVTTFTGTNASGAVAATSALSWDCTTGQVLAMANGGNADGATLPPRPGLVQVVEYNNAAADHWFLTSVNSEIAALDAGQIAGWVRTGNNFNAFADAVAGSSAVCRLYLPSDGNSHFFSASPAECAYVQMAMPAAVLESPNAFYIDTPDTTTGVCPSGTIALYRLWNHRADLDHRYTTSATIKAAMIAQGYVAEGYGPDQVAMCAPQ